MLSKSLPGACSELPFTENSSFSRMEKFLFVQRARKKKYVPFKINLHSSLSAEVECKVLADHLYRIKKKK